MGGFDQCRLGWLGPIDATGWLGGGWILCGVGWGLAWWGLILKPYYSFVYFLDPFL